MPRPKKEASTTTIEIENTKHSFLTDETLSEGEKIKKWMKAVSKQYPADIVDTAEMFGTTPDKLLMKYGKEDWFILNMIKHKRWLAKQQFTPPKTKEAIFTELYNISEGGAVMPIINIGEGVLTRGKEKD